MSRFLRDTPHTACRETMSLWRYGKKCSHRGELKRKMSYSAQKQTDIAWECRADASFTTMQRRIGGAARGCPKICLLGSRADPILKCFMTLVHLTIPSSARNA